MAQSEKLLPQYLTDLMESSNTKQGEIAKRIGVSSSYVSQFASGTTTPSDEKLVQIADVFGLSDQLAQFLFRAGHDRAESPEVRTCFRNMIQQYDAKVPKKSKLPITRTLAHFPAAFDPLIIVTGDKREDPPKTAADLGAVSASPIDDRYIHRIPLSDKVEKVSDKVFVLSTEDELREEFGKKNLLVIGSPASNHLARKLNSDSLFKFAFERKTAKDIEDIIESGNEPKLGPSGLKVLRDEKMADLKCMMHEFKQGGVFDPLSKGLIKLRGRSLRGDVDFATISIAKHPYAESDDFVAIIAAGFHLPGTIHAVKALSEPARFQKHPLGGVLEVTMNDGERWHRKIEKADSVWDNNPYTIQEMLSALKANVGDDDLPTSKDEAEKMINLINSLTNSRHSS